jgi:methylisocitrate lyase
MLPTTENRAANLRALLADHTVVLPGAINALSARLIERMGFEAAYLSGAVLANSVGGRPDVGLMTLTESEQHTRHIANACTLPLIVDADTGFGEVENTARTVQTLAAAGASGIHLEDQVFPKRCGHLAGKELVPTEDFCAKVAAAAAAKLSGDFLLIARTDARGVVGYDEAVRRAHCYLEAGADAIFPEALTSEAEFRRFANDVNCPLLANMTEFGTSPSFTVPELSDMGYRLVIFPVTLQRAAMHAMERTLAEIKGAGSPRACLDSMQTRQELYDLLGYEATVGTKPESIPKEP